MPSKSPCAIIPSASGREVCLRDSLVTGKSVRGTLDPGRRTGRSLPEAWETGQPGEESPNSAGQCAG